jgi:DNA-binding IclR family transcriptional regulator
LAAGTTKAKAARAAPARDTRQAGKNHDRYIVPGLRRGLAILQLFNRSRTELSLSGIAKAMNVPRSTAFRLLYTLEDMGFVERVHGDRGYRLCTRILTLGFEYLASLDIVDVSRPFLELLRDDTGASSHLAVRDGREIIYLSRVPTRHPLTSTAVIGGRRPAHATPMGRMMLSALPEGEIEALYRGVELKAYTDQTPTTVAQLTAMLRKDRARGFVVSRGSFEIGGASIAAPIRNAAGEIVAAIEIAGPNPAFNLDELDTRLKDLVCKAAREISARLG